MIFIHQATNNYIKNQSIMINNTDDCVIKSQQNPSFKSSMSNIKAMHCRAYFVPFMGMETTLSFEDFKDRFKKLDISSTEFINSILKDENKIGRGFNGCVYNIPCQYNMNDYVIKKHNYSSKINEIEEIKDETPSVNIGQAIARFGDAISVLKKVKGIEGIASPYSGKDYNEQQEQTARAIQLAAEMPQKGYDDFLKLILFLNKHNLMFDSGGHGNLMIEPDKAFNPIDIEHKTGYDDSSSVLFQLTETYHQSPEGDTENYKKIMYKILLACAKPENEVPLEFFANTGSYIGTKIDYYDIRKELKKLKEKNTPEAFEEFKKFLDDAYDGKEHTHPERHCAQENCMQENFGYF